MTGFELERHEENLQSAGSFREIAVRADPDMNSRLPLMLLFPERSLKGHPSTPR